MILQGRPREAEEEVLPAVAMRSLRRAVDALLAQVKVRAHAAAVPHPDHRAGAALAARGVVVRCGAAPPIELVKVLAALSGAEHHGARGG